MKQGRNVRSLALAAATVAASIFAVSAAKAETVLDLTGPVPQSTTINGAIFTTNVQQPTGTGVIRPFVRLDSSKDIEKGYNTDARPLDSANDAKQDAQYTHSLTLSSLQSTNIGGTDYFQFLLDINQTGTSPLLNLNDLQVYVAGSASLSGFTSGSGFSSGPSTLVYNIDAGTDHGVLLNYNLNSGSGSGDLYVDIPTANFNVANNTYVYLYSSFGVPNPNNDGFEEWAAVAKAGTPSVPLPASVWGGLALLGLMGAAKIRSRR